MSPENSDPSEVTIGKRIRRILFEPSDAITSDVVRVKARLLSLTLFLITLLLPAIQVVLGIFFVSSITIIHATTIFLIIYLISRTKYVVAAGVIMTLAIASMPYLFLLTPFHRTETRLILNLLIWPLVAVLFGSQWFSSRIEALFMTGQTIGLILYSNFHPAIELMIALEPIIDQAAISIIILIFTWTLNYYITALEEHKQFLEQRQRELEVYTSVLTHDLGNDMQIVKGHLELLNERGREIENIDSYLSTSLAVSERMSSVIKLFSVVGRTSEYDFLDTLQTMAKNAKKAKVGADVKLMYEPDIRSSNVRPGILLPLVLENLLRNTADYAGDGAVVTIRLGLVEKNLLITYRDDGPGIDERIRDKIFQKGVTTKGEGKGLGLYLSKRIIESYGGTIELMESNIGTGAAFLISVPVF